MSAIRSATIYLIVSISMLLQAHASVFLEDMTWTELHDAIANTKALTDDMKGKVVEEIEKGYYLNEKVIRHAKVIVGN